MEKKNSIIEKIFEPELLTELLKLEIHKLPKGYVLQAFTEEPDTIPIVLNGVINIKKKDDKGQYFDIYKIEQGESCILTIDSIIHKTKNKGQEGLVLEDTEIVLVPSQQSKNWLDKYPSWRKYVFDLYGKRLVELMRQHEQIKEQNSLISKKNDSINSSIRYARRIQKAILPSNEHLTKILPNYFIFNMPRDIVSGDFYWVEQKIGRAHV